MTSQHRDGPAPYRIKSAETWELVRTGYMRGETGPALAQRFGVGVSNIRRRASEEGWTRKALAEAEGERLRAAPHLAPGVAAAAARETAPAAPLAGSPDAGEDAACEEADPLEAARTLLRRAAAAAVAGRVARAQEAVKLAEGLARAAAALGLGDEDDDGWGAEPAEASRMTPEEVEALRADVVRRYARFDRPAAPEAEGTRSAWG